MSIGDRSERVMTPRHRAQVENIETRLFILGFEKPTRLQSCFNDMDSDMGEPLGGTRTQLRRWSEDYEPTSILLSVLEAFTDTASLGTQSQHQT